MTIANVFLVATTLCVGLMAGLFYSYSCSVVPGLGALSNTEYISAMQSINRAIQNPVFFIIFFGSLILLPICSYMKYSHPISTQFWLVIAATVIYISGCFAITIFGNIPLNNSLDKFDLAHQSPDAITLQRTLFESRWNNLNIIRTLSSLLSFILLVIACICNSENNSIHRNP